MVNIKETYREYAKKLINKGISPSIIASSDIIRLLTEDEDLGVYNFNTDNIVSGSLGELIKINIDKGTLEIYESINVADNDFLYSLKIYDLDTGKIFEDGELINCNSHYDSLALYGEEEYNYLLSLEQNDFSFVNRIISKDKDNYDIDRLTLANWYAKDKIKGLKEKLLEVVKNYCNRYDPINDAIGKIISYIDNANKKHSQIKKFDSVELETETIDIINRKLKLIGLKEESDAYSKISILPITDKIEEYKEYNAKGTDKLVNKYIKISKKIASVLDPFIYQRCNFRNHQKSSKEIDEMFAKHRMLLLKRRNELDKGGLDE